MKITKYGYSREYGYGLPKNNEYGFETIVTIIADSKVTTRTARYFDWESKYPPRIWISTGYCPIYMVYDSDSETWYEYFSGMPITNTFGAHNYGLFYDVDKDNKYFSTLSANISYENPTEFAAHVEQFTDNQIKHIVQNLHTMNDKAILWGKAFEALVNEVKAERHEKEAAVAGIESKIVAGFGSYGIVTSGAQHSSNTQPDQPITNETILQWIEQGRCAYCGGEFKGFFTKICRNCGKEKTYR